MQDAPQVLTFPATLEAFEAEFDALRNWLAGQEVHAKAHYNAELIFEEIVTNIIRHGFSDTAGETVGVELGRDADALIMTFDDGGVPFNPAGLADPDLPRSIETAKVGGLGLLLVRKAAVGMSYERTPEGRNRLTVKIAAF